LIELGPCVGGPQGEKIGGIENYKEIIGDEENNIVPRPEWTINNQNIDYCIPACRKLIEKLLLKGLDDDDKISAAYYQEVCGVPTKPKQTLEPTPEQSTALETVTESPISSSPSSGPTKDEPSSGPTTGDPCCSQNFHVCVNTCSAANQATNNPNLELTADICENKCSGQLRFLDKGIPEKESQCLARYATCNAQNKPCCFPSKCVFKSAQYSQCLPDVVDGDTNQQSF